MSAIPASTVSLKTMADGTLRISFDVEPGQAQDAFKLFAAPGTQVAIAALVDGSFLAQPVAEPKPREPLGDACYWTVMRCEELSFWRFLSSWHADWIKRDICNPNEAKELVKAVCKVTSRKELDTNPEANKICNKEIRQPYSDYLKRMEAA